MIVLGMATVVRLTEILHIAVNDGG
jgi:hypothetical protein